jgi:hypothetical protein
MLQSNPLHLQRTTHRQRFHRQIRRHRRRLHRLHRLRPHLGQMLRKG